MYIHIKWKYNDCVTVRIQLWRGRGKRIPLAVAAPDVPRLSSRQYALSGTISYSPPQLYFFSFASISETRAVWTGNIFANATVFNLLIFFLSIVVSLYRIFLDKLVSPASFAFIFNRVWSHNPFLVDVYAVYGIYRLVIVVLEISWRFNQWYFAYV